MRKLRVMVADDQAPIRYVVRLALGSQEYDFVEASDGFEVIRKIEDAAGKETGIDLLLLDLGMPGSSVDSVMEYLGTLQEQPRTIIMTGGGKASTDYEHFGLKHVGFLPTPFSKEELLAEVKRIMTT